MIFFDIDDTLTDSIQAHKIAIRHCVSDELEIENWGEAGALWMDITNRYLAGYFEGSISLEEQRTQRLISFWRSFNGSLSVGRAKVLYEDYHRFFLESCVLFDDVIDSLSRLTPFRLGIISNGVFEDQHFKLKNNGILDRFEEIVISGQIGYAKPDKRIFLSAAQLSRQSISACSYIGDNYEIDYEGAKNAGMSSFWLNRSAQPGRDSLNKGFKSLGDIVPELLR